MSGSIRIGLVLLLSLLMSSCAVTSRPVAPDIYVLKADIAPLSHCRVRAVVQVPMPDAAPGLEGNRIAVFDMPMHLNYYTGAEWVAPVPRLVQGFLADALIESHGFTSVSTGLDDLPPDLLLMAEIHGFEVQGVQAPQVHVSLIARIADANSGRLLKTVPFETTVTPQANHMPAIVSAFNQAMNDATAAIVQGVAAVAPGCSHRRSHAGE